MRSKNLWFCKWRIDGKERRKYFRTETEAKKFEAGRIQASMGEGKLTLGELTVLYFKNKPEFSQVTKGTIVWLLAGRESERGSVTGPAAFLRDKYAESLTRMDLEQMRENLRARGNSNQTINKAQAYIKAILAWGVDQDLIQIHPWRDYKPLKTIRPIITPSIETLRAIYPYLPDWLQWAVKTTFFLALRPGHAELFSLRWDAFLWRRGMVVVRQGKSGKLKYAVPHPAYFAEARKRYEQDSRAGIVYVCHRNGLRVISYRGAWESACRRAGVSMRMYDIRHIAATEMLARGADLAAVAAQLGHSNVATTGGTYAHVTAGSQAKAAKLMPAIGETKDD